MSKQEQLIEYITDDIVSFIMEDFKVPLMFMIFINPKKKTAGSFSRKFK